MLKYLPFAKIKELTRDSDVVEALRINILYMIQQAESGHLGSAMSSLDLIYYLYKYILGPDDVFFSSKGHDSAAIYVNLMLKGIIPEENLHNFRRLGGLSGHPEVKTRGIRTNTGSLGMGLSKAQGFALSKKYKHVYVLLGDGELQEGQNFEALRNIIKNKLRNITILIDNNNYQCDFETQHTSPFYDLPRILAAFGYNIIKCIGGNCLVDIKDAFEKRINTSPNVIIFETRKGKGLGDLEGTNKAHAGKIEDSIYNSIVEKSKLLYLMSETKKPIPRCEVSNPLVKEYMHILPSLMNKDIRILNSDLAKDCGIDYCKERYSEQFIEFGISEQDMVSTAGSLALSGFLPIVHSFSSFLCRRANEQIYNNATEGTKIIYVGFLSGLLPPGPGLSHTCVDDIELMKTIPNMLIFEPKTKEELEICMKYAIYQTESNVYIRICCYPTLEGMSK